MKAAICRQMPGSLEVEDIQIDNPGPGEVLIRTVAAGVCRSDLHLLDGHLPVELPSAAGHESAGVVEAVGEGVSYVKPGDNVVTCLSVFCGHCDNCLTGHAYACMTDEFARQPGQPPRLSQNGKEIYQFAGVASFAEQLLVGQNALVRVDPDIPLDKAALLGCGVTTGLGAVFNSAEVKPGSTVVVVGAGGVGLSTIQGARIAGAGRIIAVDVEDHKLALASELGATDTINASTTDPVGEVIELTQGGVDFGFEVIGLPKTVRQMFDMVRPGGTATVVGVMPFDAKLEMSGLDFLSSKVYQSSLMGGGSFRVEIPKYVDFYQHGNLKLDEMVTQSLPLKDINKAFESLKKGEVARSLITFE